MGVCIHAMRVSLRYISAAWRGVRTMRAMPALWPCVPQSVRDGSGGNPCHASRGLGLTPGPVGHGDAVLLQPLPLHFLRQAAVSDMPPVPFGTALISRPSLQGQDADVSKIQDAVGEQGFDHTCRHRVTAHLRWTWQKGMVPACSADARTNASPPRMPPRNVLSHETAPSCQWLSGAHLGRP